MELLKSMVASWVLRWALTILTPILAGWGVTDGENHIAWLITAILTAVFALVGQWLNKIRLLHTPVPSNPPLVNPPKPLFNIDPNK